MSNPLTDWHDFTINADFWLKRARVTPEEAARLLCRIDPHERDWQGNSPDPERINVDDDKASPDRYRLLRRAFGEVLDIDSKPRNLLAWRDIAKQKEFSITGGLTITWRHGLRCRPQRTKVTNTRERQVGKNGH